MAGNLEALPWIINWNVFGLGFIKLVLNQFNKVFISCYKSSKQFLYSSHLYIALLWAKLQVLILSTKTKRWLINKLNDSEPKIDSCRLANSLACNWRLLALAIFAKKPSYITARGPNTFLILPKTKAMSSTING